MEASEETEWEVISDRKNDNVSVFPPINHENLQPRPTEDEDIRTDASDGASDVAELVGENECVRRSVKTRWAMVRSNVLWVVSIIRPSYVVIGSGFWSTASITTLVVAAVVVFYKVQRRRWKEREVGWVHLLQEKDERIRQLLLQIEEMKERMLAPRRVPIYRVFTQKNYFKY